MLFRRCFLGLILLLVACGDDEQTFKIPPVEEGLAIENFGLDPTDPAPLDPATAWMEARDAAGATLHYASVGTTQFQAPDFDPGALRYDRVSLAATSEADPRSFVRWEATLPLRSEGRVLVYWFDAYDDADTLAAPDAGATAAVGLAARPIEIDFEWPDWPALSTELPCNGDRSRVFDGAEDEATLGGGAVFSEIQTPIGKRSGRLPS